MKRFEKNISLTSGGVASGIISFAIPIILSNFLQQLYNTADLMIVGKFAGKSKEWKTRIQTRLRIQNSKNGSNAWE